VTTGSEAIELMMAGASAVQIGTATFAEPRAALRIHHEMVSWAHERNVTHWSEVIGCAQRGGLVGT
jgi:Dihydroorotate dehydrogenase